MEQPERGNESTEERRADRQMFYLPGGGELFVHTAAAAALPRLLRQFVLLSHTGTHTSSHMRSLHPPVLIPPSFHHLLYAIRPSFRSGFPISASASLELIF